MRKREYRHQLLLDWSGRKETASTPAEPSTPESTRFIKRIATKQIIARMPVKKPLPAAIAAGNFGHENGKAIRPTADEVREITDAHARKLFDLMHDLANVELDTANRHRLNNAFQSALQIYADDFGKVAAQQLLAYAFRQTGLKPIDFQNQLGRSV